MFVPVYVPTRFFILTSASILWIVGQFVVQTYNRFPFQLEYFLFSSCNVGNAARTAALCWTIV